jgi:phage terminase small subunit
MSELTSKQERFARLVAEGRSQADAYREAFQSTAKPESVYTLASTLMADVKVSSRVQQLKQDLAEKSLWTRLDSVQVLAEIARGQDPEAKPADRVNATKALNQMHGWDKMTIDHTSSDGSLAPTRIVIEAGGDNRND